jgi:hypothetical protein
MNQEKQNESETILLELPATTLAKLRERADSAGQPLTRYLEQLAEQSLLSGTSVPKSLFDLIGKAPKLRTGDDIAQQIREERDAWGEP